MPRSFIYFCRTSYAYAYTYSIHAFYVHHTCDDTHDSLHVTTEVGITFRACRLRTYDTCPLSKNTLWHPQPCYRVSSVSYCTLELPSKLHLFMRIRKKSQGGRRTRRVLDALLYWMLKCQVIKRNEVCT